MVHGYSGVWPHAPVRISLRATEGASWLLHLPSTGARLLGDGSPTADERLHSPAGDVLLTLYGRLPLDRPPSQGASTALQQFLDWPPLD